MHSNLSKELDHVKYFFQEGSLAPVLDTNLGCFLIYMK